MSKVLDALDALIASFGKLNGQIDRSKSPAANANPLSKKALAALDDWPAEKQPIQRDDDDAGADQILSAEDGSRVEEISRRPNGQNDQYIYNQEVISIELVQTAVNFARLGRLRREMRWHLDHGERVDPGLCAGCRRPIRPGEDAWTLADDNRVHIGATGDPRAYACLIAHGARWRRAARTAVGPSGA